MNKDNNKAQIKKILRIIRESQDRVFALIELGIQEPLKDKEILDILSKISGKYQFMNSALACKALELIQLLNDEENIEQFELSEISELYEKLIRNSPMDISIYESAFYFEDSVMGNSVKAKKIIKDGIETIEKVAISMNRIIAKGDNI